MIPKMANRDIYKVKFNCYSVLSLEIKLKQKQAKTKVKNRKEREIAPDLKIGLE